MLDLQERSNERVFEPLAKPLLPRLTILIAETAEAFNIAPGEMFARRFRSRVDARHVVMWVMRTRWKPQPSFPEIGETLGYDHTSILSAVRRIDHEIILGSELGKIALKIGGPANVVRPESGVNESCLSG
jgi:chromosomal replication initiation ATPase DnaA